MVVIQSAVILVLAYLPAVALWEAWFGRLLSVHALRRPFRKS